MKNLVLVFVVAYASLAYSEYTPVFSRSQIIYKIDSLKAFLKTDGVVDKISLEDRTETRYESGYVVRNQKKGAYVSYEHRSDNGIVAYISFNPNSVSDKEDFQYLYSELVIDHLKKEQRFIATDVMFRFKKGSNYTEVSLDVKSMHKLKEGDTASWNLYVSREDVVLRGVVSDIPREAPVAHRSFNMSLEKGKYTGKLIYDPARYEFSISIDQ